MSNSDVGGLEHDLYLPIYWECHHPNGRTHIFQRGLFNHQPVLVWPGCRDNSGVLQSLISESVWNNSLYLFQSYYFRFIYFIKKTLGNSRYIRYQFQNVLDDSTQKLFENRIHPGSEILGALCAPEHHQHLWSI